MNAGLRCHQFVKEGAEKVFQLSGLCGVLAQFCFERSEPRPNFDLLLKRRYCQRDVPEIRLLEETASLIIVLLQKADNRSPQMVKKVISIDSFTARNYSPHVLIHQCRQNRAGNLSQLASCGLCLEFGVFCR